MTTPCVGGCGASLSEPGMCLACLQGAQILNANARRRRDVQFEQVRAWADKYLEGKGVRERTALRNSWTPADRLADAATRLLGALMTSEWNTVDLANAVNEYRSTRNGIGQTTAATFGSPPDPILIARFLLDALTGGALSSLICIVRDEILSGNFPDASSQAVIVRDNLKANLRALGEKLRDP